MRRGFGLLQAKQKAESPNPSKSWQYKLSWLIQCSFVERESPGSDYGIGGRDTEKRLDVAMWAGLFEWTSGLAGLKIEELILNEETAFLLLELDHKKGVNTRDTL